MIISISISSPSRRPHGDQASQGTCVEREFKQCSNESAAEARRCSLQGSQRGRIVGDDEEKSIPHADDMRRGYPIDHHRAAWCLDLPVDADGTLGRRSLLIACEEQHLNGGAVARTGERGRTLLSDAGQPERAR